MKYVLITADKLKYVLNESEYQKVVKAIFTDNDRATMIQGSVIPLHITPSITPFEVWYAQENERLALTHHRLCKKCLSIMAIEDKCTCWEEQGKGENKNGFMAQELPEGVMDRLNQIAIKKEFPQLTDMDKAEIEYTESKKNKTKYLEEGGYVGEEGIEHYE